MTNEINLLTTQEAAALLGLSASYLRGLIMKGRAKPARQVGGTNMFTLEEIERIKDRPKRKKALVQA